MQRHRSEAPDRTKIRAMSLSDVEIVGFRYPGGYLPYRGGMVVVYGRNGAGKSMLLESIESSLVGYMVGRTPANSFDTGDGVQTAILARADFTSLDSYDASYNGEIRAQFNAAIESARDAVSGEGWTAAERIAWTAIVEEASTGDHVAIVPAGTTESRWSAFAAIDPNSRVLAQWDAVVEAQFEASLDGAKPEDRDAAFERWINDVDCFDLEYHISNFNGFLDGGQYRLHTLTQPMTHTPFGPVVTDAAADPGLVVSEWIRAALPPRDEIDAADSDAVTARMTMIANLWTSRANVLLETFLIDPPLLRLIIGHRLEWMLGSPPHWEADGVPVDKLSDAEKRWSRIAIALSAPDSYSVWESTTSDGSAVLFAIDLDSDLRAPILLLDEPERGLHRAAERHLAEGLLGIAATGRIRPILATHSPQLLDAVQGQIFEIRKRAGTAIGAVAELLPSEVDEIRAFGLEPSSLLQPDRGYLLAEGEHDKQILEGWFADEFRSLRVSVLAMRGTRNLWTVFDSEFLIERSDALLMPLLDDVALDPLFDLWSRAEALVEEGRSSNAVGVIKRGIAEIPGTAKDIYEPMLTGAITRHVSQRFFPLGMSKKDVLEYLDVSELVDDGSSWKDLRAEWRRSPAALADPSGQAYKRWLHKRKGADLSPENIRLIAETTQPHPELKSMVAKISERLGQEAVRQ